MRMLRAEAPRVVTKPSAPQAGCAAPEWFAPGGMSEPAATWEFPLVFVHKAASSWRPLIERDEPVHPEEMEQFANMPNCGAAAWVLQAFLLLRARGHEVAMTDRFVPGAVCVAHYDDIAIRDLAWPSFVVAIEPDRARPTICNARLCQSPAQVKAPNDFLMPVWPQPAIIARDESRGDRVETLGYLGRTAYLGESFRSESFQTELGRLGVKLVIDDTTWRDYSKLDAVIAVRDVSAYDLTIKPPSKLTNAWLAGVPAMLGPEPAFQHLKESELDYFEVTTPAEALEAIRRLKKEPGLYCAMVERGGERAMDFSHDAIARRWESLLGGRIREMYEGWLARGPLIRACDPARFAIDAIQHKRELGRFNRLIKH